MRQSTQTTETKAICELVCVCEQLLLIFSCRSNVPIHNHQFSICVEACKTAGSAGSSVRCFSISAVAAWSRGTISEQKSNYTYLMMMLFFNIESAVLLLHCYFQAWDQ